jgi:prepilin-type processing-associated H-X9-DG protein
LWSLATRVIPDGNVAEWEGDWKMSLNRSGANALFFDWHVEYIPTEGHKAKLWNDEIYRVRN